MVNALQKTLDALGETADGVFAVDSEHRISYWSPAAERLLGHPAAAVLGKPCYEIIHGLNENGEVWCQRECPVVRRIRDGHVSPAYDIQTTRQDGHEVWLNVSILHAPQGKRLPRVPLHLIRDVTSRKAKEHLAARVLDLVGKAGSSSDGSAKTSTNDPPTILAPREWEALALLSQGLSTEAVAERMGVRQVTVRNYVQRILAKLAAHSRAEAIAWYYRRGQRE